MGELTSPKPEVTQRDSVLRPADRFASQVEELRTRTVLEFPEQLRTYECGARLENFERGIGVFVTDALRLTLRQGELGRFDFKEARPKTIGRADSAHQVFFGLISFIGREDIEVAVKPHKQNTGKAWNEVRIGQLMQAAGLPTIPALAVMTAEKDNDEYVITPFIPGLITLDNVDWRHYPSTPGYENLVVPNLALVAKAMGDMHGRRFVHGDAQVKNWAIQEDGSSVYIDLEGSEKLLRDEQPKKLARKYYDDIETFVKSLIHPANELMRGSDPDFVEGRLYQDFYCPYLQLLVDHLKGDGIAADDVEMELDNLWAERITTAIGVMADKKVVSESH